MFLCLLRRRLPLIKRTFGATNVIEKEWEELMQEIKKESPAAYESLQKHLQYRQEYLELTKDTFRPLQKSDELERVAAQCGLKLPKTFQ
jgi:hypothetical protein